MKTLREGKEEEKGKKLWVEDDFEGFAGGSSLSVKGKERQLFKGKER